MPLVREHPDMPVLTVHDRVLVPAERVGSVERVIAEEWAAKFGVFPNTKVTRWTDPQPAR